MSTENIIKAPLTANFTQISNTLIQSTMPPKAKAVLTYLLSKPSNWKLKLSDLKTKLGLSTYSARQALRWLADTGYAFYERLKSGHTIWRIYDTPQTRVVEPRVENPHVENQHDLITQRQTIIFEQQPELPEPIPENVVVVELKYPEQLTAPQKKAAKAIIKKCQPSLQQAVLTALAVAILAGKVKCPPAYLQSLVKSANNGTFTPVETPKTVTLSDRMAEQKKRQEEAKKRLKIDKQSFFELLKRQYGDQVAAMAV